MSVMNKRTANLLPDGQPKYVRCYDNGGVDNGGSCDRYTVVYTGNYRKPLTADCHQYYGRLSWVQYVAMSADPYNPQGVGIHGEHRTQIDVNKWGFAPAMGRKNHLGKRIPFSDLPPDCKKIVMSDYKEIWNLK